VVERGSDDDMTTFSGKIEKDTVIEDDLILTGVIIGDVVVKEGINFNLNGVVSGNLLVSNNSTVYINGVLNGNVKNIGGNLEIYGIVKGRLIEISGNTFVDKNAVIA